jgi:hypothetical protein
MEVKGGAGHDRVTGLKLGLYTRPSGTYAVQGLTLSSSEGSLGDRVQYSFYAMGGALIPMSGQDSRRTTIGGGGFAFGDADHWVATASLSSYFAPQALDFQASATMKLASTSRSPVRVPADTGDGFNEFAGKLSSFSRETLLLDHIRSGDVWLGLAVRSIFNTKASGMPRGEIGEATAVYAFPREYSEGDNAKLATTFAISGVYSSQRAFQVAEVGFHLRVPVAGLRVFDTPLFLSTRYGTRGTCTFAFETRF